jgi:hypothetical protein
MPRQKGTTLPLQQGFASRLLTSVIILVLWITTIDTTHNVKFAVQALTAAASGLAHPISTIQVPPPQLLKQMLQSKTSRQHEKLSASPNNGDDNDDNSNNNMPILMPCCYDGLTARLVARAGFSATFMTGFGVSSVHGFPDTQLISFAEMQATALRVSEGLASVALEHRQLQQSSPTTAAANKWIHPIPCIADGDTGYGNSVNAKRTIFGYGQANMAGVMIEDQVAPKRCGHVAGKMVVDMNESIQRIQAACDARYVRN